MSAASMVVTRTLLYHSSDTLGKARYLFTNLLHIYLPFFSDLFCILRFLTCVRDVFAVTLRMIYIYLYIFI